MLMLMIVVVTDDAFVGFDGFGADGPSDDW